MGCSHIGTLARVTEEPAPTPIGASGHGVATYAADGSLLAGSESPLPSTPPGAEVMGKAYLAGDDEWVSLGTTGGLLESASELVVVVVGFGGKLAASSRSLKILIAIITMPNPRIGAATSSKIGSLDFGCPTPADFV